jgi:hypothetical protein
MFATLWLLSAVLLTLYAHTDWGQHGWHLLESAIVAAFVAVFPAGPITWAIESFA